MRAAPPNCATGSAATWHAGSTWAASWPRDASAPVARPARRRTPPATAPAPARATSAGGRNDGTSRRPCRSSTPAANRRNPDRPRQNRDDRRTHVRSARSRQRSEEHTSELQSPLNLVCRLLLEKKKNGNAMQSREHGKSGDSGKGLEQALN